jgi:hypothetical protein
MTAFVLGNGVSRAWLDLDQLRCRGQIYGCNALYRHFEPDVLVATDTPIARDIEDSGYAKRCRFYTRRPRPGTGAQAVPRQYHGYSSGPIAISIAASDRQDPIYLLGFDMGPDHRGQFNNMYAGTKHYKDIGASPTYSGNWHRQMLKIFRDYPGQQFVRVHGDTTAVIEDFAGIPNLKRCDLDHFRQWLNSKKD